MMMKIRKNSRMATSTPNSSSHHISDTDSVHESQEVNRNQTFESNSSLVLLPTNSSRRKSKKKSKKKSEVVCATSDWIISSINEGDVLVSDSSDTDVGESYLLEDVSALYASDIDESSNTSNEDKLTQSFEELMELADRGSDTDSNESEDIFYQKMKSELTKELEKKPPKKKKKVIKKNNIHVHPLFYKNTMVLLMDHPASATIYRYVSVGVLSGSVSVYGYKLNSHSPPLKVFSSNVSGLIELKTESCDPIWKKKEGFKSVSHELQKVTGSIQTAHQILENSSNSTVVVILEGCVFPPRLQFVELYYPLVFKFSMTKKFKTKFKRIRHARKTYCLPCCDATIQFNEEAGNLANEVLAAIRSSKMRETYGPRILVFGPKNSGKSTLLRFLMNKALSLYPSVLFLDADPGQTEFTPPGVVSLTEVTRPVIGSPFSHQRNPSAMSFTGAISADTSPDMYSKSVAKMAQKFKKFWSREALFVNTMGWVKGIGLECLKNVLKAVKPTILIEITTEEDDSMFDYREYLMNSAQFYQIQRPFPKRLPSDLGAEDERSLSILSYFGKVQMIHETPKYLNSFKPVCISWHSIPLYIFGKKVPLYRLVEAINGSFVALCKVDESLILESTVAGMPKTLAEEPENDCLGFGIVRAVDESKHLLYVITPLPLEELINVNAIIKGNITVPDAVFLEQPIVGVPLPFTDEMRIEPPEERAENRDGIAKRYRKGIAKRYGKKKQHK